MKEIPTLLCKRVVTVNPDVMAPDFMIRVKLPNPNAFASCPSGDTDYQAAYDEALATARPNGFEYIHPRKAHTWPQDSEGWTWARLRCTDQTVAFHSYVDRVRDLERRLEAIKEHVQSLEYLAGTW